jgi:hypothetical protein
VSSLVNSTKTVSLGSDGNLTFADVGGSFFGSGFLQSGTSGVNVGIKSWDGRQKVYVNETNVTIQAVSNSSQAYNWTFGKDGALSFPDDHLTINGSTIGRSTTVDTDVNGSRLTFTDTSTSLETYVDPAGLNNTNYSRVYTNGTEVILKVAQDDLIGETSNSLTVSGNSVDIIVTDGIVSVGWTFSGSDLTIPVGGEIKTAAGTGDVVVEANDGTARTWTFGGDGALTFPDTTVQTTAYKRTTGSWTVAEGSDTYSFTVPTNGTYTMWVKGSIDNGIIVWNATASVSNTNVPVIGQQFAWNYTGGGTPIEFTAIPTQFIGTANMIVSSNPSVGTTSNKFDFVIDNTSGSAQTVYWGYVAQ